VKKTPLWEDITIILAIFSLWPAILHKESILSRIILVLFVILSVIILIRRIKRFSSIPKE
jgi:hypothetical protein